MLDRWLFNPLPLATSHLCDLCDLPNQYFLYPTRYSEVRRWCWTPRPDCLSDSLHSAVKSVSISFTKLQISPEYYQDQLLAVKNDQPREIKHYFCHLQEGKSRGKWAAMFLNCLYWRSKIYLFSLSGKIIKPYVSRLTTAVLLLICHLSLECSNVTKAGPV